MMRILPLLALLGLSAAPSLAQETTYSKETTTTETDWPLHRGLSIGGRATYFHSEDSSAARRDWYGGAQVRLHFSHYVAAEGSIDYRQEHYDGTNTTADVYPVQASLLAYLTPWARVSPFVLAGAGWYFTHVRGPAGFDEDQQRFGPHVGAGLQAFLSRHWSIDGTWRYTWVEDVGSTDAASARNYNGNGWMATGAINFHF
jgi:opacity protein-like surface antigen